MRTQNKGKFVYFSRGWSEAKAHRSALLLRYFDPRAEMQFHMEALFRGWVLS